MILESKSYLNDKVVVTAQIYKADFVTRDSLYKSDTFYFKSIKDNIRWIHYPQDILNFLKRFIPPIIHIPNVPPVESILVKIERHFPIFMLESVFLFM